jgi:hypothetical protein
LAPTAALAANIPSEVAMARKFKDLPADWQFNICHSKGVSYFAS